MQGQNLMGQIGPIGHPDGLISANALRHMCSLFLAVLHSPIMTNQSFPSDIRRYAVAGAQARLAEISLELEAIRRAFPELRQKGSSGGRTRQSEVAGDGEPATRARRRRPTMTAAQRKAVGERMTKYWAARRAGTATAAAATVEANGTPSAKVARAAKGAKRGTTKRGPRKVSAAARKRMSQAQKKRWAAKRKAA
jgi:hypothetical protein